MYFLHLLQYRCGQRPFTFVGLQSISSWFSQFSFGHCSKTGYKKSSKARFSKMLCVVMVLLLPLLSLLPPLGGALVVAPAMGLGEVSSGFPELVPRFGLQEGVMFVSAMREKRACSQLA